MAPRIARTAAILAFLLASSVALVLATGQLGDYTSDGGPALDALAHGNLSRFFELQPLMGIVSMLVRAPFVALANAAGTSHLGAYQAGAVPCAFALAIAGLALAREAGRRGASSPVQALVALLVPFNPVTAGALQYGHPEDILATALCLFAVIAALRGRGVLAAVTVGLAISTKQWAVVAALPVVLLAPAPRMRLLLVAGAVSVALVLPMLAGHPGTFATRAQSAANTTVSPRTAPTSVWWPLASERPRRVFDGVSYTVTRQRFLPRWLNGLTHPLIVLLGLLLPLAITRGRLPDLEPQRVLSLLALLFLLRSALDPVDIGYYHLPFVVSLFALDVVRSPRRWPLHGLAGTALVWLYFERVLDPSAQALSCFAYLALAVPACAYLAVRAFRPDLLARLARPGVSEPSLARGSA